jgi:hypothetical protein
MKSFHEYWTFSTVRGAITLVASMFILAVPSAAALIFHGPLIIGFAINCLATFSVFDGAIMILLGILLPARAQNRKAFYAQSAASIVSGLMLYLVGGGVLPPVDLLYITASQAAFAAFAELSIAQDTHRQYGCASCYTTALILAASAIALPFAATLDATGIALAIGTYVGLHGASELVLGGRMLFLEFRSEHSVALSQVWAPNGIPSPGTFGTNLQNACVNCDHCPADALCHDDSTKGQVAKIMMKRDPAIVRVIRATTLLNSTSSAGSL